jgi:hypothetical protein
LRRFFTSTAGTSRRTDIANAVGVAKVDMLLLEKRKGNEERKRSR